MFRNTSMKKHLVLLAALLLCATLVFAACSETPFKPVTAPESVTAEGNGGIAVKYGEWLYYINGYQSDVNATNTYTADVLDSPRLGSVVRIKLSDIAALFKIQDDTNKTSTEKSEEIEQYVRDHAETVVPKFYYSGNTTTTQFTGLYIFGDRLYITTPNTDLTSNGDALTNQLWLTSYALNGDGEKQHFKFTDNTAQICLVEKGGKVYATYLMSSKLYYLDVEAGTSKEVTVNGEDKASKVDNSYTSVTWDYAGKCVFFIDKMYNICKLDFGAEKYDVILQNEDQENIKIHDDEDNPHVEQGKISYTISSVNNGYVWYTKANSDNSDASGVELFWANAEKNNQPAGYASSLSGFKGWKEDKVIKTFTQKQDDGTFYGIQVVDKGNVKTEILSPAYNDQSITIDRIEGDTLYYTANSVKFTLNLAEAFADQDSKKEGTPYAKSLPSTAGWAAPDFVDDGETHYIISTSSSGTLSIVRFDPSNRDKSQTSISLLLKAKPAEE